MILRKQAGYDSFRCIADQCPKSCCEGWQIIIDDDSLQKYKRYQGTFQSRFEEGIDEEESCFHQHGTRCSMLAKSGLCDLQSTLGESYLCNTCRQYPRHIEEFLDLREYALSLSCPEAVRMLCEPNFQFNLTETEDDQFDDLDDFDDFDPFLFDKLTFARDNMFRIATDHSKTLPERMDLIASAGFELQTLYDEGEIFEMDGISYDKRNKQTRFSLDYMLQSLDLLLSLEVLETSWHDSVHKAKNYWSNYVEQSKEWNQIKSPANDHSLIFEKLLQSLLFTYFCGSIYDGQIYARTMIAVMSVLWIMMLYYADSNASLQETIYLFAREVEHSDLNIDALISYFEGEL